MVQGHVRVPEGLGADHASRGGGGGGPGGRARAVQVGAAPLLASALRHLQVSLAYLLISYRDSEEIHLGKGQNVSLFAGACRCGVTGNFENTLLFVLLLGLCYCILNSFLKWYC